MKQLNKKQSLIMLIGGAIMTVSAGFFAFLLFQNITCFTFLLGALCFSLMQMLQRYDGNNFNIKRLRRIILIADMLFIISGFLMIDSQMPFLNSLVNNQQVYVEYIYNKWIVTLLIAAILEMYCVHRITNELNKDTKKHKTTN